ncbi:uncharacterized protein LOC118646977 [Monomorium pharaonis]|uniref:uncharacterized protein LOC118646977 n=1 Tax=Monomorium pharaonis TaxID=307658 RepID=UPI0017460320|nr:uncharacterized protein LOC118646977 [Monomorium pharaonis]
MDNSFFHRNRSNLKRKRRWAIRRARAYPDPTTLTSRSEGCSPSMGNADFDPALRESDRPFRCADSETVIRESDRAFRCADSEPVARESDRPFRCANSEAVIVQTSEDSTHNTRNFATVSDSNNRQFSSPFLPSPHYSPISSPEPEEVPPPPSPTLSLEFLAEFPLLPPRPRYYYYDGTQTSLLKILEQFPLKIDPFLHHFRDLTINPEAIDPEVLLDILPALASNDPILVFTLTISILLLSPPTFSITSFPLHTPP